MSAWVGGSALRWYVRQYEEALEQAGMRGVIDVTQECLLVVLETGRRLPFGSPFPTPDEVVAHARGEVSV